MGTRIPTTMVRNEVNFSVLYWSTLFYINEILINQTQGHNQIIKTAGHGTESQECCKSTDMNLHSNQSFTLLSNVKMAQEQLV